MPDPVPPGPSAGSTIIRGGKIKVGSGIDVIDDVGNLYANTLYVAGDVHIASTSDFSANDGSSMVVTGIYQPYIVSGTDMSAFEVAPGSFGNTEIANTGIVYHPSGGKSYAWIKSQAFANPAGLSGIMRGSRQGSTYGYVAGGVTRSGLPDLNPESGGEHIGTMQHGAERFPFAMTSGKTTDVGEVYQPHTSKQGAAPSLFWGSEPEYGTTRGTSTAGLGTEAPTADNTGNHGWAWATGVSIGSDAFVLGGQYAISAIQFPEPYHGIPQSLPSDGFPDTYGTYAASEESMLKFSMTHSVYAEAVGALTEAKQNAAGVNSTEHGFVAGSSGTHVNIPSPFGKAGSDKIERFQAVIADGSMATDIGELGNKTGYATGVHDTTTGYIVGGADTDELHPPKGGALGPFFPAPLYVGGWYNKDFRTGSPGNPAPPEPYSEDPSNFGVFNWASLESNWPGTPSPIYAHWTAGIDGDIKHFPFSISSATATTVSELLPAFSLGLSGISSEDAGYAIGGSNGFDSQGGIRKFPFASGVPSVAATGGSVPQVSRGAGISSTTAGYQTGGVDMFMMAPIIVSAAPTGMGEPPSVFEGVTTIEKFDYASDTSASDLGEMQDSRIGHTGHQV